MKTTKTKSLWTPLTNEETNRKIFQERRLLANKWYENWTDSQRKQILEDVLLKSKLKQLNHVRRLIDDLAPVIQLDFTRYLPRFISIYIFSFLDPRSLSRCSRVCWYWSSLSSMDEVWRRKCIILGWYPPNNDPHSPLHHSWKNVYIDNVKQLQTMKPKREKTGEICKERSMSEKQKFKQAFVKQKINKPPPWRGSDPNPTDIFRNNYLDNDDYSSHFNKTRQKGRYGEDNPKLAKTTPNKVRSNELKNITALNIQKSNKHSAAVTSTYVKSAERPSSVSSTHKMSEENGQLRHDLQRTISDDGLIENGFKKRAWQVMNFDDED